MTREETSAFVLVSAETRRRWAGRARAEHASAREMSRLADRLETLVPHAPTLDALRRAAADEARHGALCDEVVARFGVPEPAGSEGPGLPPVGSHDPRVSLLENVVFLLCTGEAIASRMLVEASENASEPGIPNLLRSIAVDESRHWALGWEVLDRLMLELGAEARREAATLAPRQAVRAVVAAESLGPVGPDSAAWGVLSAEQGSRIARAALKDVVGPRLAERGLWRP